MGDAIGMGIIHSLSVMLNIMKANNARPKTVYATRNIKNTRGFEIEPIYQHLINFDNGSTGFVLVTMISPTDMALYTYGTKVD